MKPGNSCLERVFILALPSLPAKPEENGYADGLKCISPGRKEWNHLHRIASGVPAHSNASRGKTAFHIHWRFLRKGRKGTREERKGAGDSLCICVQYGFFWFFILHSRGLPRGSHLLLGWAVPACVCESGSAAALDEANMPHLSPWHLLSSQGHKDQAPHGAQRQVCIERLDLLYCPKLFVWTLGVSAPSPHSCLYGGEKRWEWKYSKLSLDFLLGKKKQDY